jgi:ABC-2 type transport system permease protein
MSTASLLRARPHQRLALTGTFTKSVADRLPTSLLVGLVVGGMGVMLGPLFGPIQGSIGALMDLMPPEMMRILGGVDMATPAGWYAGEMYSAMAPVAIVFVAILSAAKGLVGELEGGSLGLLAANPVSRRRIASDKALAMLVHVAVASLLTGLGVWLGIAIADLPIAVTDVLAMTLHLTLLGTVAGGLAMLFSVVLGRWRLGLLLAALVTFVAYLAAAFLPLSESLEGLAVLSPWYHYNGSQPLTNGLEPGSLLVLALLTGILLWASVEAFDRRDLAC